MQVLEFPSTCTSQPITENKWSRKLRGAKDVQKDQLELGTMSKSRLTCIPGHIFTAGLCHSSWELQLQLQESAPSIEKGATQRLFSARTTLSMPSSIEPTAAGPDRKEVLAMEIQSLLRHDL